MLNRPPAAANEDPLDKPVQFVRGVGPYRAKLLADAGIATLGDLIEYVPFRYEELPRPQAIDTLILDETSTIIGVVESVRRRGTRQKPVIQARISDGTGTAHVTWFNAGYLQGRLERGQVLRLTARIEADNHHAQLTNPRVEWLDPNADPKTWDHGRTIPVYRAIGQLDSGRLAKLIEAALDEARPAIRDPLPASLREAAKLPDRKTAIATLHHPPSPEAYRAARERMAYEELFMMQLAITLQRRWRTVRARAPRLPVTPEIDRRIRRRFPFTLTAAQDRVIGEITTDLAAERPMTRLLQGDVGSGKTVVALYAALVAIAGRRQVAILAPTEVLASQHFAGIERYLADSRVRRCLLTGKTPAAQRAARLRDIAAGNMDLIVGTQALLEKRVNFASLGLVVVDEQHKFGVIQRAALRGKGELSASKDGTTVPPVQPATPQDGSSRTRCGTGVSPVQAAKSADGARREDTASGTTEVPHYLVMTATPIPRTLSMTVFGDLDVSAIDALPPGRQPIETRIVRPQDELAAWTEVRTRIARGDQAYIVYPLVEESESLDLRAATAELQRVRTGLLPGARVGLIHGRMKKADKQTIMNDFATGRLDAVVATTVIEVGVDVPNATVMVIQHAERYGLSALHQLRGRVGRGTKPSICLLMTAARGGTAARRLAILRETTDGFRIAEEDLRIRGPGELLGIRQHGWPEFRVANLVEDVHLLTRARDDAARLAAADPALRDPAHADLRAELRRRFREKVALIDIA